MRRFCLAIAAVAQCFGWVGSGHAAAPLSKVHNPGYFRMRLGNFEITAVSDGTFDLDTRKMLIERESGAAARLLRRSFQQDVIPISVNAYLINTGERLILIDAGAAESFGPTLGRLLANLEASGYQPGQIDSILLTHMHPDHIGGLILAGGRAFPNATVYVDSRDADFWLSDGAREQATQGRKQFFTGAAAAIAPYAQAGRFEKFRAPVQLFSGVRAAPAPGHTPGHSIFTIESQGQQLVVWGDLMGNRVVVDACSAANK